MIALDTDVISHLMRSRPPERLVTRLAEIPAEEQSTTAITLGELAYGAMKVGRQELYDRALELLAGIPVFGFDTAAATHYGRLRADLENAGTRLADPDLRIAAIIVARGLTLITGNLKHFSRVPGMLAEDWISA